MRHRVLAVDLGIAVALVALVLIISPGLAVTGLVAILVTAVCGTSVALERRGRRGSRGGRRSRAGRGSRAGPGSRTGRRRPDRPR